MLVLFQVVWCFTFFVFGLKLVSLGFALRALSARPYLLSGASKYLIIVVRCLCVCLRLISWPPPSCYRLGENSENESRKIIWFSNLRN